MTKKHPDREPTIGRLHCCRKQMNAKFDERCIFQDCQVRFLSWKNRIDHIAKHFLRPWTEAEWRRPEEMESDGGQSDDLTHGSKSPDKSPTQYQTSKSMQQLPKLHGIGNTTVSDDLWNGILADKSEIESLRQPSHSIERSEFSSSLFGGIIA